MSGPQIILWVIALVVLALCMRRGMPQARRAVAETNRGFWRILPMFCVALPMAAFLSELMPADIATAWLGDDSGLNGIMIAALAGAHARAGASRAGWRGASCFGQCSARPCPPCDH